MIVSKDENGNEIFIMHGDGVRTWSNGDCYDGEYRDGMAIGKGSFTYSNGDTYQG